MATKTKEATPAPVAKAPILRQMTICSKGFARERSCYVFFPVILLSGKWLQDCGFQTGQVIDINCEKGRLVITISEKQRFERFGG